MPSYVLFIIVGVSAFLSYQVAAENIHSFFLLKKDRILDSKAMASVSCSSFSTCSFLCSRDEQCNSASFHPQSKTCFMNKDKRRDISAKLKTARGYIFLEKVDPFKVSSQPAFGSSKERAVSSCKDLKVLRPEAATGVYWIKLSPHVNAFRAYCDQETKGGGWTLVWSYNFTNYKRFGDVSNAVTPRPNWPIPQHSRCGKGIPVSTKTPLNETTYEAMDFALWRKIGSEFLIKSNINNWLKCVPNQGTLVGKRSGSVTCNKVRKVAADCWDFPVPRYLKVIPCGVAFLGKDRDMSTGHYVFNADLNRGWPVHDPCGKGQPNHLKGVRNPHGNVFIR